MKIDIDKTLEILYGDILKKSYPTKEKEREINEILREVKEKFKDFNFVIGGSVGKNTYTNETKDIDIFILFDKEEIKKSSSILEEFIKNNFDKYIKLHGSRDYFKIFYKNYEIEVVPILKINKIEEAETTTDFSVFHVKYVKSKLNEEIRKFIVIMKYLLKRFGIYGAESYISGFSGYAIELLGIYYKNFVNFLEEVEYNYKPKVIIDIENYYKDFKEILYNLGQMKTKSPIIIIDPTNPNRNATASVSINSFSKFVYYFRYYLRFPEELRNIKFRSIEDIKKLAKDRKNKLILFKLPRKEEKDIYLSKLLATIRKATNFLKNKGINIYDYGVLEEDKVYCYLEIGFNKVYRHYGPNPWVDRKNFDSFLEKWKYNKNKVGEIYIYDSKMCVDKKLDIKNDVIKIIKQRLKEKI